MINMNDNVINKIAATIIKPIIGTGKFVGNIVKTPFISTKGKPFGSKVTIWGGRAAAGTGAYLGLKGSADYLSENKVNNSYDEMIRNNLLSGKINKNELTKDDAEAIKEIGMSHVKSAWLGPAVMGGFYAWDANSRIKENKKKYRLTPPGYPEQPGTVNQNVEDKSNEKTGE
jgi:hypothetical protein